MGVTPSIRGCLGLLSGSPFSLSFLYICLSSCHHDNGSGSALPWGAMTMTLLAWAPQRQQVECRPCRPPASAQAACSSPASHLPPLPAAACVRTWPSGPGPGPPWPPSLPGSQPGIQLVLFRPRGVWSGVFPHHPTFATSPGLNSYDETQ